MIPITTIFRDCTNHLINFMQVVFIVMLLFVPFILIWTNSKGYQSQGLPLWGKTPVENIDLVFRNKVIEGVNNKSLW